MLPDAHALVREVDCLLKEVESLVERLGRGFEDARAKVEALDLMRRGYAAFGTQDVSTLLAASVEPMKERVARIDARLRASLGGAAACTGESAAPAHADGMHGASGVAREAAAVSARGPEDVPAVEAQRARVVDRLHEPAPSDPPVRAGGIAGYGRGDDPHDLRAGAAASHVSEPGIGGSTILRPASRFGRPHGAGSAPIVPPDPGDLDKIRQLEDECEREFSRLHFASDEERHSVLTLAAAKARRLRMAMRDSYAVDRRLGDLIRKIVDLKRRYRLGWIDGCERSFEV
ncbi:MAG TPA: hypothetical protein VKE69_03155, partial [Planctomycetota bacterium]|nr:hypothetical protein [Planctomycetota bacterium]